MTVCDMLRNLVVPSHMAMVVAVSVLAVRTVVRPGSESLARAAFVPPRLRPRCPRRLIEAQCC